MYKSGLWRRISLRIGEKPSHHRAVCDCESGWPFAYECIPIEVYKLFFFFLFFKPFRFIFVGDKPVFLNRFPRFKPQTSKTDSGSVYKPVLDKKTGFKDREHEPVINRQVEVGSV
ncbi:hypothetical protein Hanom_Chr07g00635701 [Helianthus anomalus]